MFDSSKSTAPDVAKRVVKRLFDQLYLDHPELIGHPGGVSVEDGVLNFKGGGEVVIFPPV